MDTEEFGKRYLECAEDIANVLRGEKIYDEDLVHDTYIAVYEYSQKAEIGDMVNVFVTFYKNLQKQQEKETGNVELCGDYGMLIEKYDRIDEDDWEYRERVLEYLDDIMEEFCKNPLPGERNHERACDVLELYRNGLTFREIADEFGIKCSTVHEYFKRAVRRMKANIN